MSPNKIADKVLSWAPDLDEQTKAQVGRVASMPFVQSHVALMADAHLGMGATIGSVIASDRDDPSTQQQPWR